ncbi:MAG: hypothetical protein M4579_003211 [Chaenotheca gracillima]|nr:MAG: hypothetical protein M4579_003211 [Chaenotheca gracillima]
MADLPPTNLTALEDHLEQVKTDPSTSLDSRLIELFQAQLTGRYSRSLILVLDSDLELRNDLITDSNLEPLIPRLLPVLLGILPLLQEDPEPVVTLIIGVAKPLSFTSVLSYIDGSSSLAQALKSQVSSVNILAINFLSKACSSSSDAAIVGSMKDVVHQLATVFLTHDTAAAVATQRLFESLLLVDIQDAIFDGSISSFGETTFGEQVRSHGQGLMWRRLFEDQDIYELFYSLTNVRAGIAKTAVIDKKQRTVAQTRLMGLLPYLSRLDFRAISRSRFPEIEAKYGLERGEGLLDYACTHMVDTKDDVLVHMTLIDFYSDLLDMRLTKEMAISSRNSTLSFSSDSSAILDFLTDRKIHNAASKFYVHADDPSIDPMDKSFLTGRSASYLATYAVTYPIHLLRAPSSDGSTLLLQQILARISKSLDGGAVQRGQQPPSYDLHLLASLPRVALLPQRSSSYITSEGWRQSPVSRIPVQATHEDFLKTLSVLFHGPGETSETITYPPQASETPDAHQVQFHRNEAAAARALFLLYFNQSPLLFVHLVEHANRIALKERALAAISLMSAIVTASWSPLPSEPDVNSSPFSLPTEDQLRASLAPWHQHHAAQNGVQATLCAPARNTMVQYLFSPPRTFSNLVGGRGDAESAAYKVAVAKFDLLGVSRQMLRKYPDDAQELHAPADAAFARGPWGNEGDVGGRIGTMEM